MRAVAISIILLIAVIVCSSLNAIFINKRINEMSHLATNILENVDRNDNIERLLSQWDENQKIFRLSTSLRELDRVSENLISLSVACRADNEWAIRQCCALFCDALDDIARYETFNIFKVLKIPLSLR